MNSINRQAVCSFIALLKSPNNDQLPVVVMRQSLFLPNPNIRVISKQGSWLYFYNFTLILYNFTEKNKINWPATLIYKTHLNVWHMTKIHLWKVS